ncbi:glycosyltransferase family 4 protein [Tahibacter amnicola]|uniref:Glycosyltransferase family 4 protein n=1 Tax=Tahibacter amnicola TaxID=2976241 RepID=A0ABY6BDS0_9GAMM|nr:glycosyltransferase family 4 protein [Tahibacter amnicola]UXI67965.1 glycosyltransferase family 4 protein [Tahibacter amnicola]
MKRIAIVVQRWHDEVVGGSEALAWHYAELLAPHYAVEVLTSCARDYRTWANELPAGESQHDGITLRRFPTAWPRGPWFNDLHRRLLADYARRQPGAEGPLGWRPQLAEEFIRAQGPWCPGLYDWLDAEHERYACVLFCTYLYPTTHFSLSVVPPRKQVLIPTLHDEPPAYLPVYAAAARACGHRIWLTDAERRLGRRLWQVDEGDVVGMAVDTRIADARNPHARGETSYFLYCGRIDEAKGCGELIDAFLALRRERREPVQLWLTGSEGMPLPSHPDIRFLGFVDADSKSALMAGATAFVMPSALESFSIVTLEAMAQTAPVIVNARCDVLADHVTRSGGGITYSSRNGLVDAMRQALSLDTDARQAMGSSGRRYVLEHYDRTAVAQRLQAVVARACAQA